MAIPLPAEDPAIPATSKPLQETLVPVFQGASGPCEIETKEPYANFRLLLRYDAEAGAEARIELRSGQFVALPAGRDRQLEIAYEHLGTSPARIRVWQDGKPAGKPRDLPSSALEARGFEADREASSKLLRLDGDFTVMTRFRTRGGGALMAKAGSGGHEDRLAKALFIKNGRLHYLGGQGRVLQGKSKVDDGEEHVAVLQVSDGQARLYLDGKPEAHGKDFSRPDAKGALFTAGSAPAKLGGDYGGSFADFRYWKRALSREEIESLSTGEEDSVNTPDYHWQPQDGEQAALTSFGSIPGYGIKPVLLAKDGFRLKSAYVQPLATADHAALVRNWDQEARERGQKIYSQLCVTCHGTLEEPGSLPTAPRFHLGAFKNGNDPYRIFQTLTHGYGMMLPQPQYTTAQKYDVIHYLREEFLRAKNESQLAPVDEGYLAMLPRGMSLQTEKKKVGPSPQYLLQDFGDTLFWTLQVEEGNIAKKGVAVRVDSGPGGVAHGGAWMLYDHDTMRLAACWTGKEFIDWRGIAFDGSHQTHSRIVGTKHYEFPDLPMWANPESGDFEDLRIRGRDGLPYGPLPPSWVRFQGLGIHGSRPVLHYTVGDCSIREIPMKAPGSNDFYRHFFCGPADTELKIRLSEDEFHTIPAHAEPLRFSLHYRDGEARVVSAPEAVPEPGEPHAKRFAGTLTTRIERGADEGPFAVDLLPCPALEGNPWQSWMRVSGFDFFEGGKSAAICTWNGDVWIVDGIDQDEGELKWQRICAGLFQPLGLRIVQGEIYVGCRDMIAKLVDLNGDRETDYIENFNSDHQVTEHFHEFAMGLQTDDEGNFYYAKSARHAMAAVVPHHGTLLRVSRDGSRTDILATGFRAANGVCLNPDGSFIVTDQEGHWNPKNRINWVAGKGEEEFYGNMMGYHGVTDESDEAMIQPLCWITNKFDRSPAELLWVPEDSAWKPLRGSLLNLSYGHGQIYVVPHESVEGQKQGGMCALPLEPLPTGVMRGRFHPHDGQLYACGMFAWAGNRRHPRGFYRIRYTGQACHLPVALTTGGKRLRLTFTDPLDKASAEDPGSWAVRAWDLRRSRRYGSKHVNERPWPLRKASLSPDGRTVTLDLPDLRPTWGMSIEGTFRGSKGEAVTREIHNSIFRLAE